MAPRKAEMREAAIAMGKTLAKEGVEVRMLASSPPRGWPELTRLAQQVVTPKTSEPNLPGME